MKAARRLIRNNYVFPQCHVAEAMKASWAKNEALSIVSFARDCCDMGNQAARAYTHQLYAAYIGYCVENGLEIESENLFSRVLGNQCALARNRWSEDGNTAQRGFIGIQIRNKEED